MKKYSVLWVIILVTSFIIFNQHQTTVDGSKQKKFLSDAYSSNHLTKDIFKIEYDFNMTSNDNVGNKWYKTVTFNGQELNNGDTIAAPTGSSICMQISIVESDKIQDCGTGEVTFRLTDGANGRTQIIVSENRGQHAGNTAVWKFDYTVTSVKAA